MKRPFWIQNMCDNQLREMIVYADDIMETGKVRFSKAKSIINKWYNQRVGIERALAFCVDVYKEASFRWMYRKE